MCGRTLTALVSIGLAGCVAAAPRQGPIRRVLCYGDSITQGGSFTENWPRRLADTRPDLAVSNGGLIGDTSHNAARLEKLLAQGPFDWVVILIGVNDPLLEPPSDAERTVQRILRLARLAHARGADVIILTLPPTTRVHPHRPDFDCNAYAHAVSQALLREYPRERGGIRVADLRDAFGLRGVDDLTVDGLHPNEAGNALIAAFVSERIPRADVAETRARR